VSARLVAGFGQASSLVGEALERWLLAVTLRVLQGEVGDMAQLQRVIEAAPDYVQRVTGLPPGPADSQSTYTMLPEGKGYDDKFVYGIYRGDEMVGCVDLIRGWPDACTAHLGLLLVAEPFQRQGIGAAALRLVEEEVLRWGTCTTIRLGVVATNAQALPFWQRQGFVETGEVKPYRYGSVESEVVVLAKRLDAVPVGGNAT
jgi:ribosomal protein S18 acetylase RimI-like enzyme